MSEHVGGFDSTYPYVVDLDYWCRLLAHGDAWVCPEALASFRVHRASWSFAPSGQQSRNFIGMVDSLQQRGVIRISAFDRSVGALRAKANQVLRVLAYRLLPV